MKVMVTLFAVGALVLSEGAEIAFAQPVNGPPVREKGDKLAPKLLGDDGAPSGTLHQPTLDNDMPKLLPRSDVARAVDAYKAAAAQLKRSLDTDLSGDPDADFKRLLIAQYEGMIALASVALDYGTDPKMREAAEYAVDIATQELETIREQQPKP